MAKLIVVEDDQNNAVVLSVLLTRLAQHQVHITQNTEEILDLCATGKVDLVIMDISLVGSSYQGAPMDGLGISRMLKSSPRTGHIPVLLYTAHVMAGDRERFLESSSADSYLGKPVANQELVGEVDRLLKNRLPRDVPACAVPACMG